MGCESSNNINLKQKYPNYFPQILPNPQIENHINNIISPENNLPNQKIEINISRNQFIFENGRDILNEYYLAEEVGSGAFGKVKKCIHKLSGQVRAVKILKKEFINETDQKRFFDEISILKRMDHPNILKLYQLFQDSRFYYLVTEYLSGGELFDRISSKKHFSEGDAANIMKQLLSAVSYCHANQIVHRDLKPENLLLDSNEDNANLKVIDFGTSQIYDPNIKMRQKYGTPYYIAPEVLNKLYDEKCDIWSSGVIMYIILSGYPPFNGKTDIDIMNAVRKGTYNFNTKIWTIISEEAKDLIRKMLAYDSKKRITAAEALIHPWFNLFLPQVDPILSQNALATLRNFRVERKLQNAALMYIATQLLSQEDTEEMQKIFEKFDINHDGKLSREELIKGFRECYGICMDVEGEVDQIMKNVDLDHNSYISYSEFVIATINKRKLITRDKLLTTFKMFDIDSDGFISKEEIKSILKMGQRNNEVAWDKIMTEVKLNENGEISFEEFEKMMIKII